MKTFVNFLRQGLPTVEHPVEIEETREVSNRDTAGLEIPTDIFGFYFFDVCNNGKEENISPMHYIGGKVSIKEGERFLVISSGFVTSTFRLKPDDILVAA